MSEIKPSYPIIDAIVPSGCHGKLAKGQPTYIVIHETAGPGAPAINLVNWWRNGGGLPVHYTLDWLGKCYRCVPEDTLAWHVGKGNAYTIGIELCHATTKANFEKVWRYGVEWAAWQLSKRGWGVDRLMSHYECGKKWGGTDHTDPIGYFAEYGRTWEQFRADVKKRLDSKEDEVTDAEMRKIAKYAAAEVWAAVLAEKTARKRLIEASDDATSKKDPTGRDQKLTTHDHVKWIAAAVQAANDKLDELIGETE